MVALLIPAYLRGVQAADLIDGMYGAFAILAPFLSLILDVYQSPVYEGMPRENLLAQLAEVTPLADIQLSADGLETLERSLAHASSPPTTTHTHLRLAEAATRVLGRPLCILAAELHALEPLIQAAMRQGWHAEREEFRDAATNIQTYVATAVTTLDRIDSLATHLGSQAEIREGDAAAAAAAQQKLDQLV